VRGLVIEDREVSNLEGLGTGGQSSETASGREEALRAEVQRLQVELDRFRAHAQRTSKLFLSATNYAEWVRENARRDAELALRKARARVARLERVARDLERTERELDRARRELADLQALADETRTKLSAFLTTGLEMLGDDRPDESQNHGAEPAVGELHETLQRRVSTSEQKATTT
jgi:hypothetical protein